VKTINLTEAFEVLTQAAAVVLEGRPLYPTLFDIEYDNANEFLHLQWQEDGLDFQVSFCEGDNQSVKVDGHILTLINVEGEEEEIELLTELNVEG
jgi:hypothetical protein